MCGPAPCHYFGYMCRNSCTGCEHCRPGKKEVAAAMKKTKNQIRMDVVSAARLVLLAWLGDGVDGGRALRESALPGLRKALDAYDEVAE